MKKLSSFLCIFIAAVLFCSQDSYAGHSAAETISFESELFQAFNVNFKMGLASLKYKPSAGGPRKELSIDYFETALQKLGIVQAQAPDSAQGRLKIIEGEILEAIGNIQTDNVPAALENTVRVRSQMFVMHTEHEVVTTEDSLLVWHNGVTHRVEHLVHENDYEELKWMKPFMDGILEEMSNVPFGADPVEYTAKYNAYITNIVTPYYDALEAHSDPHAKVDPENALMVADDELDAVGLALHGKPFGLIYLGSFEEVVWP